MAVTEIQLHAIAPGGGGGWIKGDAAAAEDDAEVLTDSTLSVIQGSGALAAARAIRALSTGSSSFRWDQPNRLEARIDNWVSLLAIVPWEL